MVSKMTISSSALRRQLSRTPCAVFGLSYSIQNCRKLSTSQQNYMTAMQQQFDEAKQKLNLLKDDPGSDTKLKIYALFKQATTGKVTSERPGMVDFVARAKWDAWNSLGEMNSKEAQQSYVNIIDTLINEQSGPDEEQSGKYETLLVTCKNGLRTITLNRPDTRNAFNVVMYLEMQTALREAAEDKNTVVTALTGAGSYYSTGNDLKNFMAESDEKSIEYISMEFKKFVDSFIEFPKPLIGVVNGPAIGIAVTTLALCDAIYASDKAYFQTPFTALGLVMEGSSSYTFPMIMGHLAATEYLFFNKKMTVEEAKSKGLVTDIYRDLDAEVWPRLQELAKLPVKSLIYSKQLVRRPHLENMKQANRIENELLKERLTSEDCMQAMVDFSNRKKSNRKS